jgi:hypothetical protein
MGAPERKKLEDAYKIHIQPHVPFSHQDKVPEQLENMIKDRQVLSAHGVAIYQECKGVTSNIQGTLRTLQSNAVANASKKKGLKAKF